jgi:hypothetical protein
VAIAVGNAPDSGDWVALGGATVALPTSSGKVSTLLLSGVGVGLTGVTVSAPTLSAATNRVSGDLSMGISIDGLATARRPALAFLIPQPP